MILGQTIQGDSSTTLYFFTPWFPRRADNAKFTFERIHSTLSVAEEVEVYHKEAEESGTGDYLATADFSQLGSTRFYESDATNLKELVRFRIKIDKASGMLHFRFLQPTWFATAEG